ncbi:SRPBCC family protein [Candidatus Lucifugimonas marina]|uniref:SRPBCC family protein n=1 Tax=Candidatus Lucifugimonas marina TaxID=3038979 RepID=A0AAJ5ZFW2_9CHLR|nr:hypothetical protein [SAR202 cluster bacterium JH702]MDG0870949.1 hypothetical protein [SAR202 cluster bacterium JH639]WFG36516.1 hypothetical protein GKN94_12780 [SAR202 cluster bacterium JH545]WFG40449.1 hypothetical protein GKO48_12815 [SAR202 cluster bacterium JH1073]
MSVVSKTKVVNGSIAKTWEAISKMGAVQDWHPNVARVEILSSNDTGVGASRRVEFHDGNSAVETVIKESEQQFTTMEMTESPMIKKAVITIKTEEQSADKTNVTFSIDYSLKFGPIGWLMSVIMLKRIFNKVFTIALAGLSYHLETGKIVTDSVPDNSAE